MFDLITLNQILLFNLGKPSKPTKKPVTIPSTEASFVPPSPPIVTEKPGNDIEPILPCSGRLFVSHDSNCNQYYVCNQGQLQIQTCPNNLYWNKDHCDWPENTQCHPDGSTTAPIDESTEVSDTVRPSVDNLPTRPPYPGTDGFVHDDGLKVVCYFTNWAWYR